MVRSEKEVELPSRGGGAGGFGKSRRTLNEEKIEVGVRGVPIYMCFLAWPVNGPDYTS
jgi:hypothetical protein